MDTVSKFQDSDSPTLIMIRGLPGSGKSYLATTLQESLGKEKVVIVDPDKIDKASKAYITMSEDLAAQGVDEKLYPYRFLRSTAYDAIVAHQIIIWNQAFTNLDIFNRTIINLQAYASEHDTQLPVLVVEVEVNHNIAKERVATREKQGGHGVPEDAFARFIDQYESFSDKGYNLVIVNGEDDVSISAAAVTKSLEKLRAE